MSADSLCYIMDYSGNYFRVDQADRLVVAADEKEATVFTYAQQGMRRKEVIFLLRDTNKRGR